jgi:hypothetical protein
MDRHFERCDIGNKHVVDLVPVNLEVIVNESMTHPGDLSPWDGFISIFEDGRQPLSRFADDLYLPRQAVRPHRGTASFRTCLRNRFRIPASLITSTFTPNSSCKSMSKPP